MLFLLFTFYEFHNTIKSQLCNYFRNDLFAV